MIHHSNNISGLTVTSEFEPD